MGTRIDSAEIRGCCDDRIGNPTIIGVPTIGQSSGNLRTNRYNFHGCLRVNLERICQGLLVRVRVERWRKVNDHSHIATGCIIIEIDEIVFPDSNVRNNEDE